ncbi:MAG: aromatic acid exporter family protein, partial [Clostridiales Family XIII bacterium]|nr:aromatic acid exporter family protein [Clostridiales Family XIII bacterium]
MKDQDKKRHPLTIGMRTVKTALSVLICMLLYRLAAPFGYTTNFDAFLACTAAVICMQDSVEKSLKSGRNRLAGTGVGALLG